MSKITYLWIEDRKDKAAYIFWKTMMGQLFPEIVVESKKNSSELVKAVRNLSDWIQSCCGWDGRQNDDICGLDINRISLFEKMRAILINTSLESEFYKAGWEAAT